MFDRVVTVLIAFVLAMLGAANALACSECGLDTGQCLASLELQAEEAPNADLEAVLQSIAADEMQRSGSNVTTIEHYGLINGINAIGERSFCETSASGAAGVWSWQHNQKVNVQQSWSDTSQPRLLVRTGWSSGVGA